MKEAYFTFASIDDQAERFLDSVRHIHAKKEKGLVVNPGSMALLVLDMQRYFLEQSSHAYIPSAKAIVPNIKQLQETFLNRGLQVYQTRHINDKENAKQMKTWWKDLITRENPFSALIEDISDAKTSILEKSQYDAFYNTNLEKQLLEKGIKQVVITGVMTHLCCETTARSAFVRGFEVFLVVDGTATYNQEFHLASLLNLSHGFARPVLTWEIISELGAQQSLPGVGNES